MPSIGDRWCFHLQIGTLSRTANLRSRGPPGLSQANHHWCRVHDVGDVPARGEVTMPGVRRSESGDPDFKEAIIEV